MRAKHLTQEHNALAWPRYKPTPFNHAPSTLTTDLITPSPSPYTFFLYLWSLTISLTNALRNIKLIHMMQNTWCVISSQNF